MNRNDHQLSIKITGLLLCCLTALFLLSACGRKNGTDPITAAELGSTLEQAAEADPTLTEYSEDERSIDIDMNYSYAGAEGRLLMYFYASEGEPVLMDVKWICEPTDGSGKAVYDELFAALRKCYGKPQISRDRKNVTEGVAMEHDEAQAKWDHDGYSVSCTYYELHNGGRCQIIYHRWIRNSLKE